MSIDKSPPWKAVSWAEKFPDDPQEPLDGLTYWMVLNAAGYTVVAEWMTEEQARTIAAAPELRDALRRLLATVNPGNAATHAPDCRCVIHDAIAALEKATVLP